MLPRWRRVIDRHFLGPDGPTPAGTLSFWATFYSISIYALIRYANPGHEKVDFDLSRYPVSVQQARKLYEKLGVRLSRITGDIRGQCEKDCLKEMRPCSILLQLEAMNGGIERRYGAMKVALAGPLDRDLRVLEDCDDRRGRAFWQLEDKCKDGCRVGLKPCRIMHEYGGDAWRGG